MAVLAGEGVEIGVGGVDQRLSRRALRRRDIVDHGRPRGLQQLHGGGRDIGVEQLLDLGDHPPFDLQAQGDESRLALDVQHRLHRDLAGQGIGDGDAERGGLDRPAPEVAFADAQAGGVLGEHHLLGQGELGTVLA